MKIGRLPRDMSGNPRNPKWSRASFKHKVLTIFPEATVVRTGPKLYQCRVPLLEDNPNDAGSTANLVIAQAKSPSRVWKEAYQNICMDRRKRLVDTEIGYGL